MAKRKRTPEEEARRRKIRELLQASNIGSMEDIFIACTDNLTGFTAAIEAVFPKTEIQNCIIHQLRNSSKYVSYKDLKALMTDLKAVYAAVDEDAALAALDAFSARWDAKYPKISSSWRDNWVNLSTYFKYVKCNFKLNTEHQVICTLSTEYTWSRNSSKSSSGAAYPKARRG